MDLEAVWQGAEQLQGSEDVEQLEAIEEHDDDAPWRPGLVDGHGGSASSCTLMPWITQLLIR
jgi:hypothetical protein